MKYTENEAIIEAFLTCVRVKDIARKTGLSASTVRRYKADPNFQRILRERQSDMIKTATSRMQMYLTDCVETLHEIVIDKNVNAQTRANASTSLLAQCKDWVQVTDILERLDKLENASE